MDNHSCPLTIPTFLNVYLVGLSVAVNLYLSATATWIFITIFKRVGGLSNIDRFYQNVPALWGEYVFAAGAEDEPVRTKLVAPMHGDSSGVRGAAWLWPVGQ